MTESDLEGITLICPDQVPKSIKVQKPIHILFLPPAWSATSFPSTTSLQESPDDDQHITQHS